MVGLNNGMQVRFGLIKNGKIEILYEINLHRIILLVDNPMQTSLDSKTNDLEEQQ